MIEIIVPTGLLMIGFVFMCAAFICGNYEKNKAESVLVVIGNVFAIVAAVFAFFTVF